MIRLEELAKFIPPYQKIADIGCDHGLLIKKAFSYGITFAQAIDNKEGPLEAAKKNLGGFCDAVEFSLSDGLSNLSNKVEVIILAGLGADLAIKILDQSKEKLKLIKRMIIQVNKNPDKIREYSKNIAFKIVSEKIIFERKHFYEIIVFEPGERDLRPEEILFGPCLLQKKDTLFIQKWKEEYLKIKDWHQKKNIQKKEFIENYVLKGEKNAN
ncbi:MAG: tRNA (adenine(22)-N(1))-methyltransferase TrmK [Bacilli bacterium]|nr:tRNA (adenine(22)-N(1))-methyltransferase TrmK [Bacilli bacterium]